MPRDTVALALSVAALSAGAANAAIPAFTFLNEGYEMLGTADTAVDEFASSSVAVLAKSITNAPGAPPPTAAVLVVSTTSGKLTAEASIDEQTFDPTVLVSLGDSLRLAAIATEQSASARILQPASPSTPTVSIDDLSGGHTGTDTPSMFASLGASGSNGGPVLVVAAAPATNDGGGDGGGGEGGGDGGSTPPSPPRPIVFWDVAADTSSAEIHLTSASDSVSGLTAASSVVAVSHKDGTLSLIRMSSGALSSAGTHSFTLGSNEELQVAASHSGDLIAAGSPSEGVAYLYSGVNGSAVATLNSTGAAAVDGLAFTTAGSVVVLGKVAYERDGSGAECPQPQGSDPDPNATCTVTDKKPTIQVWTAISSSQWNNSASIEGTNYAALYPLSAEIVMLTDAKFEGLCAKWGQHHQGTGPHLPSLVLPQTNACWTQSRDPWSRGCARTCCRLRARMRLRRLSPSAATNASPSRPAQGLPSPRTAHVLVEARSRRVIACHAHPATPTGRATPSAMPVCRGGTRTRRAACAARSVRRAPWPQLPRPHCARPATPGPSRTRRP